MRYLKKILQLLGTLILLLGLIHISLNILSPESISLEFTIKEVNYFIKDNILLSIIISIVFLLFFYLLEILILYIKAFLKKYNPLYKKIRIIENNFETFDLFELSNEVKNFKPKLPFAKYKTRLYLISARVDLILSNFHNCYSSLRKLENIPLENEREVEFNRIKYQLLVQSGDLNGAKYILNLLREKKENGTDTIGFYEAQLLESEGDLWNSRKKLQSLLSNDVKFSDKDLLSIYNNLGRIEGLFNNYTNKLFYFKKALEIFKAIKSKYMLHIIYPNIIDTSLLLKNYEMASMYFCEYSAEIDYSSKYDLLNYYNYSIEHYRQLNNKIEFINTICLMHKNLYPKFSLNEQLNFDISELRFRFNSNMDCLEILLKINSNISLYDKFGLSEKLIAFKEIYFVLETFKSTPLFAKFSKLYEIIFIYFQNTLYEIDNYIKNELYNFQIKERCSFISDKIFLLNFQNHDSNNLFSLIKQKLTLIEDIIDIYESSGNLVLSFEYSLNYIDECMHSLEKNISSAQASFLNMKIKDQFEIAEKKIDLFSKYPDSSTFFIRLARYSLLFSDNSKAKLYIKQFEDTKISINHFSNYIKQYYFEVKKHV